ncbi:MAG: hypothetical protein ABR880_10475 [Candidatus Sulfotelmatobacter sp.]
MSYENKLQEIATALRKGSPYFKAGWNISALQAFIRDGGCCVYCGKLLLNTWDAAKTATIDHLLPANEYWEKEFQTARMRFQDAVTQYRQYKESPATA